jgi:hypothetical protein
VPELDPELARWIGLGLLAILVLLLLAILGSLGRLRKSVEASAARGERASVLEEPRPEPVGAVTAARAEPEPARGEEPEPVVQAQPATAEPEREPARQAEPEPVQAAPEPLEAIPASETGPAARETEPVAREPEPAVAQGQAAVQEEQLGAEEPQEQPFERDGRWWFRRGDELLVYNDTTGQWEQAAPAAGSPAPASGAVATERAAPAQTQEQQGFWKCPSCGAVNGSTATSCRMCFTARP